MYGRDSKRIETDTLNLKGTGGVFRHEYTYDFWSAYDEKDTRRDVTFLEYYTQEDKDLASFGCVMKKGIGSINSNNNRIYDTDIIIYRYADALLMMAEVANGLVNHAVLMLMMYVSVLMATTMPGTNTLTVVLKQTNWLYCTNAIRNLSGKVNVGLMLYVCRMLLIIRWRFRQQPIIRLLLL